MPRDFEIVPLTRSPRDVDRFLHMAYAVYRNDPHWVAPLLMDQRQVFLDTNPFFTHARMQLWLACHRGRPFGRIAAIYDQNYVQFQRDPAAFWGFFECGEHDSASAALFEAACAWARQQGARRMLGPMNPSTNDECGLLVQGFDRPPAFMMTYNPDYYPRLVEQSGFVKARDLLAYFFDLPNTPMDRFERIAAKFAKREPDMRLRPIRKQTLAEDIRKVTEVYNEAWEANWGFVPMTPEEIRFMAKRLKPLLYEGLAYVMETPTEPIGFLLAAPDYNQAFLPLRGRLLSPGLFRALPYLMQWKTTDIVRVITLGVKKQYRGRGVEAAILCHGLRTGFNAGFKQVEASWVLEDNEAVKRVIELFGGRVYKTYRVYQRDL